MGETCMYCSAAIGWGAVATLTIFASGNAASAATQCDRLLALLNTRIADATCFDSADLTTNNPATTPANNSLVGLPAGAFTPQTDRGVISPPAGFRTPITKAVPGIQLQPPITKDPIAEARILILLPDHLHANL